MSIPVNFSRDYSHFSTELEKVEGPDTWDKLIATEVYQNTGKIDPVDIAFLDNRGDLEERKDELRESVSHSLSEFGKIISINIIEWDGEYDYQHATCVVILEKDSGNPLQDKLTF